MKTTHPQKSRISLLLVYWLPPFAWAFIIFAFSSMTTGNASQVYWQDFVVKKLAHVVEYGLLSLLLYRAFLAEGVGRINSALLAVTIAVFYGASDEIHQMFTPGRRPRVYDVIFDTIGALTAIYLVWKLLPKAPQKLKNWAKKLEIG